jgi:hypothetical protein
MSAILDDIKNSNYIETDIATLTRKMLESSVPDSEKETTGKMYNYGLLLAACDRYFNKGNTSFLTEEFFHSKDFLNLKEVFQRFIRMGYDYGLAMDYLHVPEGPVARTYREVLVPGPKSENESGWKRGDAKWAVPPTPDTKQSLLTRFKQWIAKAWRR